MKKKDAWVWIGIAGVAAVAYYAYSQGLLPVPATATPLSIYPELAYTALPATTSMAATGHQQAPAAIVPATPYFTSVQAEQQNAILAQCIGANICSPLTGDTQLGL